MATRKMNGSTKPQGHSAAVDVATQLSRIAGLAEVAVSEVERGRTRNGAACAALALLAASELLGDAPTREAGGVEEWLKNTQRTLNAALRGRVRRPAGAPSGQDLSGAVCSDFFRGPREKEAVG